MAPKKKKKTKAEIEAELRAAEEEARRVAEAAAAAAEAERAAKAAAEAERAALAAEQKAREEERLEKERLELASLFLRRKVQCQTAEAHRLKLAEFERYLLCSPLPDPWKPAQLTNYLAEIGQQNFGKLGHIATLTICDDLASLASACQVVALEQLLRGSSADAEETEKLLCMLHSTIANSTDAVTAHILQHADAGAAAADSQVAAASASLAYGVWINFAKNPRLKQIEFPEIGAVIELPKSLALANIAVRLLQAPASSALRARNGYMPVGGVWQLDCVALPAPAKQARDWTLRTITPMSSSLQRLPYPIPPAGADPNTWMPEEEVPPIGLSVPVSAECSLVNMDPPQVARWDPEGSIWTVDGISEVVYSAETRRLSFKTQKVGLLALVQPRSALLPYRSWTLRPVGGRASARAVLSLDIGAGGQLELEIGAGYAVLLSADLAPVQKLVGQRMPPISLLHAMSQRGLHLIPQRSDADFAGVVPKESQWEEEMCIDMAPLAASFMLASSKWNASSSPEHCIIRVSEVVDWEEGGRTEAHHCRRIFTKEKVDNAYPVMAIMRRGSRGVAFIDALDHHTELPRLPDFGDSDYESSAFGKPHASALTLLEEPFPGLKGKVQGRDSAASPEALLAVRDINPVFSSTLTDILLELKLLSFG